ncbi:MAG TPA: hypothetical protein VFN19_10175 [Candidatus Nanopelagicales bacterium]|nr:hypothetical protein [Candidatus Nanopelagicales bacterium]
MDLLDIALVLHVFLLVYWLGGDLGTYYSSRYVMKPELSVEARQIALKIMTFCDMFPRICLVLFLPSGLTLLALGPYEGGYLSRWLLIPIWIAGLAWLWMVLTEYRSHGAASPRLVWFRRLDLWIRYVVIAATVAFGLATLIGGDAVASTLSGLDVTSNPRWLGLKIALYGTAVLAGVMIRRELRPFGPAWGALVTTGSTAEVEAGIGGAIARSETWVYLIWICVVGAAFLGIVKPGAIGY